MQAQDHQSLIPTRAIAAAMTASSETMEDYLDAKSPPVRDGDLDDCFVVFGPPGASSLLTVAVENHDGIAEQVLVHVRPSNRLDTREDAAFDEAALAEVETSDAGWRSDTSRIPDSRQEHKGAPRGDIYHLRAFQHRGRDYALVHFRTGSDVDATTAYVEAVVREDDTQPWQTWKPGGEAGVALLSKAQTEVLVDAQGRPIIFGRAKYSDAHDTVAMVFYDEDNQRWDQANSGTKLRHPGPRSYRLINDNRSELGGILLRFGDGSIVEYQTITVKTEAGYQPILDCRDDRWQRVELRELIAGVGDIDASRFIPVPGRASSFVVHASDGRVWLVNGFGSGTPRASCLSDDGNLRARIVRVGLDLSTLPGEVAKADGQGTITVYAVERSGERRLWVKREAATSKADAPSFDAWVALGNQTRTLAVPNLMPYGAEVFLVSEDGPGKSTRTSTGGIVIERKNFDGETGQGWHGVVLEATQRDGQTSEEWKCTTHTTLLTLLAKDGSPAYRAAAELRSEFACTAVVNGVSRHLRPDRPLRVFADDRGLICVKTKTDSVDGPALSVTLNPDDSKSAPLTVRTTEAVARRFAGKEVHAKLDKQRLTSAGLLPERLEDATKNKIVQMIGDAGQALGRNFEGGGRGTWYHATLVPAKADGDQPHWQIHTGDGELPVREQIQVAADSEEIVVPKRGRVAGWGFLGDIFNWMVETAEKVVEFTLKLGRGVVELVVEIGKKVFKCVVDTTVGLIRGIEALLVNLAKSIGAAVDAARQLLEVVKALFDRDAIARTNDAFHYLLQGGLRTIEELIGDQLTEATTTVVTKVVEGVNGAIEEVKKFVKGSLGQVGQQGLPDTPEGPTFANKKLLLDKGGVQARWAADKLAGHRDKVVETLAAAPLELDSRVAKELRELAKLAYNPENPGAESLAKVASDLADDLGKSFAKGGMSMLDLDTILTYCQRMVAMGGNLMTAVTRIVFSLIADAVAAFRKLLDTKLDIPGIKQLGELVLNRTPKLGDLLSFVPAVAVTVFWKICTYGRSGEIAGAGTEPFPRDRQQQLLREGPFSAPNEAQHTSKGVPLASFMLAHYRRTVVKAFGGQQHPQDEQVIRQFLSESNRAFFRWVAPINNCVKLAATILSSTLGAILDAARDGLNIAKWDNGKWIGRARLVFFTLPSVLFSLIDVLTDMVKINTIEFFPSSEDGIRWQRERELLPPWDWPSLSWLVGALGALIGLLASSFLDPTGAGSLALYAVTTVLGGLVVIGTAIYVTAYVAYNVSRGKLVNGWKIAAELGTMLGGCPSLWGLAVPALAVAASAGLVKIAVPLGIGLLLLNGTLTVVAGITSAGNIISAATIQGWGFPTSGAV